MKKIIILTLLFVNCFVLGYGEARASGIDTMLSEIRSMRLDVADSINCTMPGWPGIEYCMEGPGGPGCGRQQLPLSKTIDTTSICGVLFVNTEAKGEEYKVCNWCNYCEPDHCPTYSGDSAYLSGEGGGNGGDYVFSGTVGTSAQRNCGMVTQSKSVSFIFNFTTAAPSYTYFNLWYDTWDSMNHVGAYAKVTSATFVKTCNTNSDCTTPGLPVCEPVGGCCMKCTYDDDCLPNPNTTRTVCEGNYEVTYQDGVCDRYGDYGAAGSCISKKVSEKPCGVDGAAVPEKYSCIDIYKVGQNWKYRGCSGGKCYDNSGVFQVGTCGSPITDGDKRCSGSSGQVVEQEKITTKCLSPTYAEDCHGQFKYWVTVKTCSGCDGGTDVCGGGGVHANGTPYPASVWRQFICQDCVQNGTTADCQRSTPSNLLTTCDDFGSGSIYCGGKDIWKFRIDCSGICRTVPLVMCGWNCTDTTTMIQSCPYCCAGGPLIFGPITGGTPPYCTGSCVAGSTEPCGTKCGTKTCSSTCGWGVCENEGACTPGQTQSCVGGGTKTCNSSCQWVPDANCDKSHNICNASQQCVAVAGVGENKCQNSSQCATATCPPDSHTECVGESCVCVVGTGDDKCQNDSQCTPVACPPGSHTECVGESCECILGEGPDKCKDDSQCTPSACPPGSHTECAGESCICIVGAGEDKCQNDSQCTPSACPPGSHTKCDGGSCGCEDGTGDDQCQDDSQCTPFVCPSGEHASCVGDSCKCVIGEGEDQCQNDSQCGSVSCPDDPFHHTVCDNGVCECVPFAGVDECQGNDQCVINYCPPGSYASCIGENCICVVGTYTDECQNNSQCETPFCPADPHHTICAGNSCVCVSGVGVDACLTGEDCLGVNPTVNLNSFPSSNYCVNTPSGVISLDWVYQHSNNVNEKQFNLQIDDNSNFSSPEVNIIVGSLNNPSGTTNLQSILVRPISTTLGGNYLTYNKKYYWGVRVWDINGRSSIWPPSSPKSFYTPDNPFPSPDFDFTMSASPSTLVSFYNSSICYNEDYTTYNCQRPSNDYLWTFGDGQTSSAKINITHTYPALSTYYATLNICDDVGCCTSSPAQAIGLGGSSGRPGDFWWKEINPF